MKYNVKYEACRSVLKASSIFFYDMAIVGDPIDDGSRYNMGCFIPIFYALFSV